MFSKNCQQQDSDKNARRFPKKKWKNNDLDELYVEIITLQKCFDLSPVAGQHCAVLIMITILWHSAKCQWKRTEQSSLSPSPLSYFHKWIYYFQALTCPPRQDGYALTHPTNYCQPWPWRVFLQITEPVMRRQTCLSPSFLIRNMLNWGIKVDHKF